MTKSEQQHLIDNTPDISFKLDPLQMNAIQMAVKEVVEESVNGAFWSSHDLVGVLKCRQKLLRLINKFFDKASTYDSDKGK